MKIAMRCLALLLISFVTSVPVVGQTEVARDFSPITGSFDHERREVMIPMRDGVKLHTVIVMLKNGSGTKPIILTRTPYGANGPTEQTSSPSGVMILPLADEALMEAGYIRVYQDIRGRYDSQGDWVMTLPPRGPLNRGRVDESTDTWDTIDWLVKNVSGNNGKVGITGISYAGWLTIMGLLDPHPALKAAVPMYPMVDGWIGDDFYHNGALRQTMFEWIYNMGADKSGSYSPPFGYRDMYDAYLSAGSADALAHRYKGDALATWRKIVDHPAYDAFWSGQAVQDMLKKTPIRLPTMFVHGLFDQEDNFGGMSAYQAMEANDTNNDMVFLALGPWSHGQSQEEGSSLGAIRWGADTSLWFRTKVLLPFWNHYLKGDPEAKISPATAFDTGTHDWKAMPAWPAVPARPRPLFLTPGGGLKFTAPIDGAPYAEYVSDPAKPVPYRVRPVLAMYDDASSWREWLVDDQRPFSDRTDVLTFTSDVLTDPLTINGEVIAHLFASTSGSDSDWIVKLIDVYPPEMKSRVELGGYQLMVAGDIMRGRYRESLSEAKPATPDSVAEYRVRLPHASHTFKRGHRLMVQVQSSWFPLYDRNPQTFVANIAKAQASAFRKATQRIYTAPGQASYIALPVVPE